MPPTQTRSRSALLPLCLIGGFLVRLIPARLTFLNPDECLHYFLSHQPSLGATYRATLTTAHPPLLILLLHCWQLFGHSEIYLRLPFLVAGTAFAWVMYLWLKRVSDSSTALTGLVLLLFSPALITVSSEVRQYAPLLLFAAGSLYFLERAIEENSAAMMLLSAFALYLALLTHYSSLIFALTLGIYALARLRTAKTARVAAVWGIGQLGALGICGFLYKSHLAKLQHSALRQEIADTWLRVSIYHPGQDHPVAFVVTQDGPAVPILFQQRDHWQFWLCWFSSPALRFSCWIADRVLTMRKPTPRQLALLLTLPFVITAAIAVAGLYPYGGTRHDVLLAAFAMSGVALGLAQIGSYFHSQRTGNGWQSLELRWRWAICIRFRLHRLSSRRIKTASS